MDTNYITLGVAVVGFVSTLLTHKYHINLHSKKLESIEKDLSKTQSFLRLLKMLIPF